MHPTKSKALRVAAYSVALLAVGGFLGWHALFPPGDYRDRLRLTADNLRQVAAAPDLAQSLKVYAVNVVHTRPLKTPFVGYGVYLGKGTVLTAAHVVGWPGVTNLSVLIAGQDLAAGVIKMGSLDTVDLALLSVDESRLPVSLRLRRSPICKEPLRTGTEVAVVRPGKSEPSRVISPEHILPRYRAKFGSLINHVKPSGSGVFDVARGCLLGIISRKIEKVTYRAVDGRVTAEPDGYAGYFVPPASISAFLPDAFKF